MASFSSSEWRSICEKFRRAQNLSEIESRKDPENDPFRSKYNARELLKEIYSDLKNFDAGGNGNDNDDDDQPQEQHLDPAEPEGESSGNGHAGDSPAGLRAARLGVIEYYLGVNHVETEELSAGEEHLMNCIKLLDKCSVSQENVAVFIQARVS